MPRIPARTALRRATLTVLALALAAATLGLASSTPTAARAACTIDQLTSTTGGSSGGVVTSADATHVAFYSDRDLTGENADGSFEIFLFDVGDSSATQLTDTTAGSTFDPSISADASHVAFYSDQDLTGDNADLEEEIFLFDVDDGSTTQLTDSTGSSTEPSISADGGHVAFTSDGDLTGDNADSSLEIFLYDTTDGTTTQLTDTTSGFSDDPSVTTDGGRVAFRSDGDHTDDNADGSAEIFLVDTTDGSIRQLTDAGSGGSLEPAIAGDGTQVAFSSHGDLTGDNADGNSEIFLHDTTDGTTTQLTDADAGSSFGPTLASGGTRVGFRSSADIAGDNADRNFEVYVHDTDDGTTSRLTETDAGSASGPSLVDDGTRVAFSSMADVTGDNPDGNSEVFFATCGSPTPSFNDVGLGHPFFAEIEWLAEVEVTGGFADGGYHPAAPVSRQAMAAFMFRLAGEPPFEPPAQPSFDDVGLEHPFFAEIEWLARVEITGGFGDGGYHPAAPVTRQAMAAFMFRLAGQPPFEPGDPTFNDVGEEHPFLTEIEWLASVEVTGGFPDGGYHPAAPVTRQAMAAFMFRLADGPGVGLPVAEAP